ncbi:hypothetical protein [Bradyrhizobium tunisiense]|uniref:hypothetical protein n=1 Tax=Bradyrhizobium tunisiense TaxID=3278709 RepID=UPI0035D580BE
MRSVWGIVAGLVLALMTASCNTTEEMLIERGIGTELPSDDIVDQTRRMALYLNYLCAQAGMSQVVADGTETGFVCDMKPYGGAGWSLLVRAGFNDIDRRCDSYLAWLNSRRRNRAAILDQITDTRTFTEALLYTTGAGAAPIAIAGLAFGLASNSFTNYYSRLLFEIEKSTVQVLVHQKRLQFREKLGKNIAFQPDAVHVLREYLLICTPFYIEDLINQRTRDSVAGNEPADKGNADQIRRSIVADSLIRSLPAKPRDPLPPVHPVETMGGGETDSERNTPKVVGQTIQANLCVPTSATFDPTTREAIRQAKVGGNSSGPNARPFVNLKNQIMSAAEVQIFLGARPCGIDLNGIDRGYQTAFEKFRFADENGVKILQGILALCDPTLKDKASGKFDVATRAAIKVAKSKMSEARKAETADRDTDTLTDKSFRNISLTCI